MPWSTTSSDRRRYFSQFGRSDEGLAPAPSERPVPRPFPAFGEGTFEAIREYEELYGFAHADVVVPLLERWQYLDRVAAVGEKQDFLEPLIATAQARPATAQGELIMVLIALEPLRRSIAGRFMRSQQINSPSPTTPRERADARLLREVELRDVVANTRADVLRVVHSYRVGKVASGAIFGWFKEALSHRLVQELNLAFRAADTYPRVEAEAVRAFLHGLEHFDAPELRHQGAFQRWRRQISAGQVYAVTDDYLEHPRLRQICRGAIARLAPRQREAIERFYYDRVSLEEIARDWQRAASTARNTKKQAEASLRADDIFFTALAAVGAVRDAARLEAIRRRYPDGRPPATGSRRVIIDAA